jgi:hypothetical protein
MAGGIWDALGAALSAGGRTFGVLNQEEIERKRIEEQQKFQNKLAMDAAEMQRRQFEASMQDRKAKQLEDAIRGARPDFNFAPEFIQDLEANAPHLKTMLKHQEMQLPEFNVQMGVPEFLGGAPQAAMPTFKKEFRPETWSRTPTLDEESKQQMLDLRKRFMGDGGQAGTNSPLNDDEQLRLAVSSAFPGVSATEVLGPKASTQLSPVSENALIARLTSQWDKRKQSAIELERQFNIMQTGLDRFEEDPNGASQAVLVTFQKILDPNSVVRESEYARSPQGLSLLQRIQGWVENKQVGGAGVPKEALAEMVETARQFIANADQTKTLQGIRGRIQRHADKYNIDPMLIFDDLPQDADAQGQAGLPRGAVSREATRATKPQVSQAPRFDTPEAQSALQMPSGNQGAPKVFNPAGGNSLQRPTRTPSGEKIAYLSDIKRMAGSDWQNALMQLRSAGYRIVADVASETPNGR